MTNEELTACLQRLARDNNGKPPGESRFYRDTKLSKEDLWDADIRTYGDLCELAGFQRNSLQQRLTPEELLMPLAALTEKLGRFPNDTDRRMARRANPAFPGRKAYQTAQNKNGPLRDQLLDWCRSRREHSVAAEVLEREALQQFRGSKRIPRNPKNVKGFVYLMRYGNSGRHYKLGMTEQVPRRQAQLSAMFPGDLRLVHAIQTDDPAGIERYWKRRFEHKRIKNKEEIFQLLPEDIATFKWRKYQ